VQPAEEKTADPEIKADPEVVPQTEAVAKPTGVAIQVSAAQSGTDAQLDGILSQDWKENQAYGEASTMPDFITASTLEFDVVDGIPYVTFNYNGQKIRTKFKPSARNMELLPRLINAIEQVKKDPTKKIVLKGLARTFGQFQTTTVGEGIPLTESRLWSSLGIKDPMDVTPQNTIMNVTTGGPESQATRNGMVVPGSGRSMGAIQWAVPIRHDETGSVSPKTIQLNKAKMAYKPGIAKLVLDLMLSKDPYVTINGTVTSFTPQ
jgi:hypothetical protein